ncbi:unnamed protein product [Alopecurus aequalis]
MAKAHAGRRRLQEKCAMGRSLPKFWSLLVLLALALLAAACTGQRGGAAAGTHGHSAWDGDDTLQRRQAAMGEAVRVFSGMPEDTAGEARAKEEARAELLTRHFGQLLPGASVRITIEQGRILAHLSGGSGADFYRTSLHLGSL